mgnify:FL=1|nr:DUF3788 family protein [uncultured Anaerocolumna sp.]
MIQDPGREVIKSMLGNDAFLLYDEIYNYISDNYNMDKVWDNGGKYGKYVIRFQKSKKTLCTLYIRDNQLGVWIIFGRDERDKFDKKRDIFCEDIANIYDATEVYHDGKWLMLDLSNDYYIDDIKQMLLIKKKPNIKLTMCGYCCEMCKAYAPNIRKNDERNELANMWKKYYNLDIPPESIYYDGCRCTNKNARRVDNNCPVRVCVMNKGIEDCSECVSYPCNTFMERKGLSYEEAENEQKELFNPKEYQDYMLTYDNKSRLDRKLK